jgi:cytoskeletal protein CcmA (bactofilin family)
MFSSKKESASAAAAAAAAAPAQTLKRANRSSAPSIISSDLVVNGTLTSAGDIQIDGRVEGDVRSAGLVVGDKAFIHGEVIAEDVTIRGRVQGSIRARKVLLCATSHVEGNILHEAFAVETGAFFEGNCRHADNPLSDENAPKKPSGDFRSSPPSTAPSSAPSMVSRTIAADASRPVAASFAPLKSSN